MTDYKYKYGHGYKEFSLPEEHVLGELKMKQMMPLENLKAAVLDALYHPIASAPIDELVQPGMKIAFICNDSTRVANTHSFMPILVNEMNKLGVKDEDMHIVFALGTHRCMTHDEMVEQVGEDVAKRLKCITVTVMCRTTLSISAKQSMALLYGSISMFAMLTWLF